MKCPECQEMANKLLDMMNRYSDSVQETQRALDLAKQYAGLLKEYRKLLGKDDILEPEGCKSGP